jgi:hypothetical protein
MTRPLRPRGTDAVAVVPAVVTDRTAPAVVGLDARAFRAIVAQLAVPHTVCGRRMLVRVADFVDAIGRPAEGGDAVPVPPDTAHDDADTVLARIGRRRSA